jgi:hypothetical protein
MRYTQNRFVTLGDPRQSGATLPHEGVFYETSLKVRRAHPIAYMDFSLDQETAFGDSLAAISMANEAAEGISHMCLTILRWSLVLSTVLLRQILWYSNGRLCEQRIFS